MSQNSVQNQPAIQISVHYQDGSTKQHRFKQSLITFGRDDDNDVMIDDTEVSRHHARLTYQDDFIILEDLGSTNGTFVNDERLTSLAPIRPGETFMLGKDVSLAYAIIKDDDSSALLDVGSATDMTVIAVGGKLPAADAKKRKKLPKTGPLKGEKKPAVISITENAVLGDLELQKRLLAIDEEFGEFCIRVSGEIFGKPLLDQKTKALIAIAVDVVAMIKGIPFENHVDIALKQGATPDELRELILLMTIYAGFNKAGSFYGLLERSLEKIEAQKTGGK